MNLKTHKMYLLLEVDTWEPENAAGSYPGIGGHNLLNRLKDVTRNGQGMFERLMIKVLAAQKIGEEVIFTAGGKMEGNIMLIKSSQIIVDTVANDRDPG